MFAAKFVAQPATKCLAVVALGLSLAHCAGSPDGSGPGPRENSGTLLGAGTGAVVGAAVGGLLGGLIGNRIGASLDDEDRRRAYAAQIDALETGRSGAPVSWKNPDSGRHGTIVPGPAYEERGHNCRSFTHTIYIDGRPQTARGTACHNPDGTWTPLT